MSSQPFWKYRRRDTRSMMTDSDEMKVDEYKIDCDMTRSNCHNGGDSVHSLRFKQTCRPDVPFVIILYFTTFLPGMSLYQQYIYWWVARDVNMTSYPDRAVLPGNTKWQVGFDCSIAETRGSHEAQLQYVTQETTSNWLLYIDVTADIPAYGALAVLMFLKNISIKSSIILPLMGLAGALGHTLLQMQLQWPLWVLILGSLVNSFSGGSQTFIIATVAYQQAWDNGLLAFRKNLATDIVGGFVIAAVDVVIGVCIEHTGFTLPCLLLFLLSIAAILYVVFILPTPGGSTEKYTKTRISLKCITRKRTGNSRAILLLMIASLMLYMVITDVTYVIQTLYLLHSPFCFSPMNIGVFLGLSRVFLAIGQMALMVFVRPSSGHRLPVTLSMLSVTSCFLLLASNTWMGVLLVPLMGCGQNVGKMFLLDVVMNMTPTNEQAQMMTSLGLVVGLCDLVGLGIFVPIYGQASSKHLVFYGLAALSVGVGILFGVGEVLWTRIDNRHKEYICDDTTTDDVTASSYDIMESKCVETRSALYTSCSARSSTGHKECKVLGQTSDVTESCDATQPSDTDRRSEAVEPSDLSDRCDVTSSPLTAHHNHVNEEVTRLGADKGGLCDVMSHDAIRTHGVSSDTAGHCDIVCSVDVRSSTSGVISVHM